MQFVEPEDGCEISLFDIRYFKIVKEGKKNRDFTLLVECKVVFECEFVGFEIYCNSLVNVKSIVVLVSKLSTANLQLQEILWCKSLRLQEKLENSIHLYFIVPSLAMLMIQQVLIGHQTRGKLAAGLIIFTIEI